MKRGKSLFIIAIALVVIWAAATAWWFEPESLTLTRLDVTVPSWPQTTAPIKVALISDVHVGGLHIPPARVHAIAAQVNALHPDVILLGGDYVGGDGLRGGRERASGRRPTVQNATQDAGLKALGDLQAPLGVYAAMGNHDCYWNCQRVRDDLADTSVRLLENDSARLARPGGDIWIVGIEDGQTQKPNFASATSKVPAGAASLVLVHNPGLFDWPSNPIGLQLSGHTHAGQVRLPFIGAPIRMARHTEDTAKGWTIINGRILIVTRGLGESGMPIRFGAPPQIMLLTLHPGAAAHVEKVAEQRLP